MYRICHRDLERYQRKSMRTGNWRTLNFFERALYRAAMWYAKRRFIIKGTLVKKLLVLIEKLKETNGMRIFKRGLQKASELLENGDAKGVFVWAHSLRYWLKDPDYIFWLGTMR